MNTDILPFRVTGNHNQTAIRPLPFRMTVNHNLTAVRLRIILNHNQTLRSSR